MYNNFSVKCQALNYKEVIEKYTNTFDEHDTVISDFIPGKSSSLDGTI